METGNVKIDTLLTDFKKITKKPELFLSNEFHLKNDVANIVKNTYDITKNFESIACKGALPELIIKGFDSEQIWQQIELQSEEFLQKCVVNVSKLSAAKDRLVFKDLEDDTDEAVDGEDEKEESDVEEPDEVSGSEFSNDEPIDSDDQNDNVEEKRIDKKYKSTIVDDEFFKLNEMNEYLLKEEKRMEKDVKNTDDKESDSEDSVDLFAAGSDDSFDEDDPQTSKMKNPRYKDYFKSLGFENDQDAENYDDDQSGEKDRSGSEDEENEEETRNEKSSLELRRERLNEKIQEIEEVAVGEKPWQLKGEITAETRPQNSLLEEILEFDIAARPAPVITQEVTLCLEDIIKQRIKDKAYDDVERKQKPVDTPIEYKKKLLLNDEKSKESLAQIYEREFIEQREAKNPENEEKEEEEPQLHKEIKTMMQDLFRKLDALSNFHFTPKPAAPELKIISNLPAINMEEVAPVAVSDAALLAPEEIKRKAKGDIIGKSERTSTDKKRERRKKKLKQKVHAIERQKKGKPALISKQKSVQAKVTTDKKITSTTFFDQLQEEVKSQIKNGGKVRKQHNKIEHSAKRIKL